MNIYVLKLKNSNINLYYNSKLGYVTNFFAAMLFMNKEEILNFRKNNNLTDVTVVATFKLEEVESVEVEH